MKILHIIPSLDPKGGGPIEGVLQMSISQIRSGGEAEIVCFEDPAASFLVDLNVRVHALGKGKGGYAYHPVFASWLGRNFAKYDALVIHGIWQYHSYATWRVLRGKTVPYFVYTHGMLGPWFKYTYPLKHLKKWLYWPWADYRVLRDAKAVLFTCEEERRLASQSFWLYQANECVTGFGTALPSLDPKHLNISAYSLFPELRDKRVILFLGRLHAVKGCDLLIQAFARVVALDESLHLLVVGSGEPAYHATLVEMADELGLTQRITWAGLQRGDAKWAAVFASEVLVLPSHHENFGVVLAEAIGCGVPVLISNKVNIWREIEADKAGFVDTDTVEGTLRNLKRWLSLSASEYAVMSERADITFKNRFHIDRAAQRLLEIIRESIR